ncbi:MAG: VanZ family protein [bacterium]
MKQSVHLLLLIVWITVIFMLTGFPSLESPKIKEFPIDKFEHFLLFFIYGLIGIRSLNIVVYFASGILVIITAEVQQIFIPGRDFEIMDMIAGLIGLITVAVICGIEKGRQK